MVCIGGEGSGIATFFKQLNVLYGSGAFMLAVMKHFLSHYD